MKLLFLLLSIGCTCAMDEENLENIGKAREKWSVGRYIIDSRVIITQELLSVPFQHNEIRGTLKAGDEVNVVAIECTNDGIFRHTLIRGRLEEHEGWITLEDVSMGKTFVRPRQYSSSWVGSRVRFKDVSGYNYSEAEDASWLVAGLEGDLLKDDKSDLPLKVKWSNGKTWWVKYSDVERITEGKEHLEKLVDEIMAYGAEFATTRKETRSLLFRWLEKVYDSGMVSDNKRNGEKETTVDPPSVLLSATVTPPVEPPKPPDEPPNSSNGPSGSSSSSSGSSGSPSGSSPSSNPSPSDPIQKPTNLPEPDPIPQKEGDRISGIEDKCWWTATTIGQLTLSVLVLLAVGLLTGLAYTAYRMKRNAEEPIEYDVENPEPLAEPIEIVIDPSIPAPAEQKMVVRAKQWRRVNEDEYIGKGSYGTVYLSWSNDLGTYFATKEIILDDYLGGDEDMITATMNAKRNVLLGRITNELILLRELKHPNILQHFGEEISISKKRLYIFTELMSGTIQDLLKKNTAIPNKLVVRYGNDILAGLRYLHEHEPIVVHRDIKPSNLLIDLNGRVKLADFGTVKILDRLNDENTCRYAAGTYLFAPPEMHKRGKITPGFDVWSLAITLHMMVTCHTPWPEQCIRNGIPDFIRWLNRTLAHGGIQLDHPNLLANPEADVLKDMILGMLAVLPDDRPTVAEIQQFPFFKNYDDTTPVTDASSSATIDKLTELMSKEDWRLTETRTALDSDECKMSDPVTDATHNLHTQDEIPEEKKNTVDDSIVIEYGSTAVPPVVEYRGGDSKPTLVLEYYGGGDSNGNTYNGSYRYSTDYDER